MTCYVSDGYGNIRLGENTAPRCIDVPKCDHDMYMRIARACLDVVFDMQSGMDIDDIDDSGVMPLSRDQEELNERGCIPIWVN